MGNVICSALFVGAAGALLAACAPPPSPVPLPPGPTGAEVTDYAIAQAQYRAAEVTVNGDVLTQAENTFRSIPQEILSRQDPRLFDAWAVCESYPVTGSHDPRNVQSTFEPEFARDCHDIGQRYRIATGVIRRDLEAKIAAADRATAAQAEPGRP